METTPKAVSNAPHAPRQDALRWRSQNVVLRYDRSTDILYIHALPVVPSGGVYAGPDDEILLLIAADGEELVGAQIENFRSVWLKKHGIGVRGELVLWPILQRLLSGAWRDVKGTIVTSVTGSMPAISGGTGAL